MPEAAFLLLLVALMLGPFAGIATVQVVGLNAPTRLPHLYLAAGCAVVVVPVAAAGGVRMAWTALDLGCCLAALLGFCLLAAGAWSLRPRAIGVAAGLVAHGMLACCMGAALYFPTAFVLMFVLGDMFAPPVHGEEISSTLSCRVWSWGASFGVEGYTVSVYRHLPMLPLVMVEAAHTVVNETEPGGPRSATCAGVAAQLAGGPR